MSLRPKNLAQGLFACALLACLSVHSGAAAAAEGVSNAQKRAAQEYLAAVASGSPQNVAYAIHPADLEALRMRLLMLMREEAGRNDSTLRGRLFGAAMPLADIERMTSINFYAALARRLSLSGREYSDAVWLGTIPDRGGAVNVVLRGKQPKDHGDVQVVQVVTLKPYGKDWKAAIPSEIEAQIDDLISGRRAGPALARGPASAAQQPSAQRSGAAVETPPAISTLLTSAEAALAASKCDEYYEQYMSPNFRRVTSSKAMEALIATCQRSLGTREMLLSTVKLVRGLQPRFEYQGQRAVYDLSGQGLPFDSFALEQIDKRWYIAE